MNHSRLYETYVGRESQAQYAIQEEAIRCEIYEAAKANRRFEAWVRNRKVNHGVRPEDKGIYRVR